MAQDFPQHLIQGYQRFRNTTLAGKAQLYSQLATKGQKPSVMMIACCDSRAVPDTIFDADPGELFVVRNIANLVHPYDPDEAMHSAAAALEFAVLVLEVQHIVVLGHARCGGIQASLTKDMAPISPSNFVGKWLDSTLPLAREVAKRPTTPGQSHQRQMELASVNDSVTNLISFPFIKTRVQADSLALHGAWFDIENGELQTMNPNSGEFSPC